ncbi:hypothetical protein BDY21DRAFT_353691 [Lineolata rhizophorae]|uniref:HNH nuclease domain-containing protein n=1 Tax=Lineolata rhizophorae TaxID=578093 RepID=A0A6A6NSV6_9PEZI|nr:hypothetical protein BDY21DRAFT_353691 [Lineolata rhizophorae]
MPEGGINFSTEPPLEAYQRTRARRRFYQIVDRFEAADCSSSTSSSSSSSSNRYNRPRLVRLTFEHALSEESKDNVLRAFFRFMPSPMDEDKDIDFTNEDLEKEVYSSLIGFAEYLLNNFFLPLKASSRKTPQPSPVYHSAVQEAQGAQEFAGTPTRLSTLRGSCLVRDRHRCVITRRFDLAEAERRIGRSGSSAQDDDGELLANETRDWEKLEVAHILPHSLTKVGLDSQSERSKQAALMILNMFDNGVAHLIEGIDIDRPRNAITLTPTLHWQFGSFRNFFTPSADHQPHTYRIDSHLPVLLRGPLPVTRSLYLTETRTIDPPSPRLLAVHRAISYILHLSAAGEYIDKILEDIEEQGIRADGSTELGRLVSLRLYGWLDGTVDAY